MESGTLVRSWTMMHISQCDYRVLCSDVVKYLAQLFCSAQLCCTKCNGCTGYYLFRTVNLIVLCAAYLICLMDTLMNRMGVQPILPVKVSITINTMLNFDGDFDRDGDVICKQKIRNNTDQQETVRKWHKILLVMSGRMTVTFHIVSAYCPSFNWVLFQKLPQNKRTDTEKLLWKKTS